MHRPHKNPRAMSTPSITAAAAAIPLHAIRRAQQTQPAAVQQPIPALRKRADTECAVSCSGTDFCCPENTVCSFTSTGAAKCEPKVQADFNDVIKTLTAPSASRTFNPFSALQSQSASLAPEYYSSVLLSLQENPTTPPEATSFVNELRAQATYTPPASNKAAVAGGAVGGVAVLVAVGVGVWFFLRKRRRQGDTRGVERIGGDAPDAGTGYMGYRGEEAAGAGYKGYRGEEDVKGPIGVELDTMQRPLPAAPPAWELDAGRRTTVHEMDGGGVAPTRGRETQVWHEMDGGETKQRWN